MVSIGEQCPPSNPVSVSPTSSNPSPQSAPDSSSTSSTSTTTSTTTTDYPTVCRHSSVVVSEIDCRQLNGDGVIFCDCDTPSATCILIELDLTKYTNNVVHSARCNYTSSLKYKHFTTFRTIIPIFVNNNHHCFHYRWTPLEFAIDEQTEDYVSVGDYIDEEKLTYESDVGYNQYITVNDSNNFLVYFASGSSCSGEDGCVTEVPFLIQVEVA